MQVALYLDHDNLPFWHNPSQPNIMFDPSLMADWMFGDHPFEDTWLWPVLIGLISIDFPVMAHVSIRCENGVVKLTKRVWVQITTYPTSVGADNLPIIVKDGKPQVEHLWGGDNKTYSPWEFFGGTIEEKMLPETWRRFFTSKLRKVKKLAKAHLKDLKQKVRIYDAIHSSRPIRNRPAHSDWAVFFVFTAYFLKRF